jgi:hypothetical protein
MRVKFWSARRRRTAVAGTLVLAMAWGSASAWAQTASEEELPADTKFFRKLFKEFGMQMDGEAVEFRERAPLVVPPSRSLPPPQTGDVAARNPAWPKDPDVRRRNEAVTTAAQKARLRGAAESMAEEGRALRPNELEVGRVATGSTERVVSPEESARPMKPSELGSNGLMDFFSPKKSLGNLFSSKAEETAEFTQESPRSSLTEPPPGYQTPSAAQPYGLGPARAEPAKPSTITERAVGNY